MAKKFSTISLFSGAGGLDAGLERTGRFETLCFVEHIEAFARTLSRNVEAGQLGTSTSKVVNADISELDPFDLMADLGLAPGEVDVVVGGPPCQTFSTAGRRGTIQDARGTLLWDFARFVSAIQPRFFIMENVRGLLSAAINHRPIKDRPDKGGPPLSPDEEPGSVVTQWVEDLRAETDGRYRVDCFEVNAANYGAPQIRERVLFIGNREGRVIEFPQPTHGAQSGATEQLELEVDTKLPFKTLGEALNTVEDDDGEILDFSPRKKSFLSQVPEGGNWRALDEDVQRESMGKAWHAKGGRSGWWRRLTRDLPSPTIVTMPNHASTAMCHPTETRALTLKECAAVQEFPAEWRFEGTTAQKYTQVGNALPLRLAEVAGEAVVPYLEDENPSPDDPSAPNYRRVYLDSHVRTRQWYRRGETFLWQDGKDNSHAQYSAVGK